MRDGRRDTRGAARGRADVPAPSRVRRRRPRDRRRACATGPRPTPRPSGPTRPASLLHWDTDFTTTCEWELPFAKWFTGGRLNVSYNCLDRHVADGHGDQVAILWEGEPGDTRSISYGELLAEVGRTANALKELGVVRGDRVAIYMGMVPELPIAMLACAAHRRRALRGVRRLHRRLAARPHQRRRGARARHRRRRVATRRDRPAQGDRRRGARRAPRRSRSASSCGGPPRTSP